MQTTVLWSKVCILGVFLGVLAPHPATMRCIDIIRSIMILSNPQDINVYPHSTLEEGYNIIQGSIL